jgi:hypothetical protein
MRNMKKFYVILTDWEDALKQVVAWVENPYIAISYFREYKKIDRESEMIIIECDNHVTLSVILRENYATDVDDLLECHLIAKTSKDGRCYVIYKERYNEHFSESFLESSSVAMQICDTISRIMLVSAPLIKFLNEPYITNEMNLTFGVYSYTSIRKMMQDGTKAIPLSKTIDIVYFWRFVNAMGGNCYISNKADKWCPVDAIFIDS